MLLNPRITQTAGVSHGAEELAQPSTGLPGQPEGLDQSDGADYESKNSCFIEVIEGGGAAAGAQDELGEGGAGMFLREPSEGHFAEMDFLQPSHCTDQPNLQQHHHHLHHHHHLVHHHLQQQQLNQQLLNHQEYSIAEWPSNSNQSQTHQQQQQQQQIRSSSSTTTTSTTAQPGAGLEEASIPQGLCVLGQETTGSQEDLASAGDFPGNFWVDDMSGFPLPPLDLDPLPPSIFAPAPYK